MGTVNEDVRIRVSADGAEDIAKRLGAIENKIEKIGKETKKTSKEMGGLTTIAKGAAVAIAGMGFASAMKDVLDFDSALGQLQADIGMSNSGAMALRDRILQLSSSYGVMKEEVLGAYQTFQGFAGDIEKYRGTMDSLVMTHKATGTSLEDLAKLQATLTDSMMMTPEAAMQGIASLRAFANAGTIELRNMAAELPELLGGASSLGFTGQRGITQVGTALGVAGQAFGGKSEQARTSVNTLFTELQKKAGDLKKNLGIQVFNKDGSMKDLTLIMEEVAKKTGYGTARGKKGLVNFFGESSLKTVATWMTMIKSGKVQGITQMGQQGKMGDIEAAYKRRMEGVAREAEILKGMLASINSSFAGLAKMLTGFTVENPITAAVVAGGTLAAPLIAKGIMGAAAGVSSAVAAGGATAAMGVLTQWIAGPALAALGGAAIGHFAVDEWLGKQLFGKSMSSAFADRAVDPAKQAAKSARYKEEMQRYYAEEQVRRIAGLEAKGIKNFGGADAIAKAAAKAQGLEGNAEVLAELKNIAQQIKDAKPSVTVKPAGGTDRVDARAKRSQQ